MNTKAPPLKVGLIGAGMIGHMRARAISHVATLKLAAVADARTQMAQHLAGPNARVYSEGLELAADPNLDAVIISTPPVSHEELAIAALKTGKHVLVEKPLAVTAEACDRMVQEADAANVTLATGFNLRYARTTKLAKKIIAAGGIGQLDHIRGFHGHKGGKDFGPAWIVDKQVTGGGSLMDNGIHVIDLTRYFLGDVQSCHGFATNHTWQKNGCEDNGFLLMKNAQGRIASLQSSWTEWRGYGYRMEIYGTTGFIRFGYPPLWLVHGWRVGPDKFKTRRHWFAGFQIMERLRGWEWSLVETLADEMRHWADAICRGVQPPVTGRDGAEAVRLALSAEFCSFSA